MNGIPAKIEIFKPFGEAYALTKKILFQPFDFKKWCVIGFAAFLTYLGGGSPGLNLPGNWNNRHTATEHREFRSWFANLDPIWWVVIGALVLAFLVVVVVLTWVKARGHFVFTDCVVRNRAAIVQPWNEYAAEGNNYFVFLLLVTLALIVFVATFGLAIFGAVLLSNRNLSPGEIALIVAACVIFVLVLSFFGAVIQFVSPVMYRRRCKAWPALVDLVSLFSRHPGPFVLYFLFSIVLGLGVVLIMMIATCATCCLAALPYVGTVILLPVFVCLKSFALLFLRQFGPDYDVWAGIEPATPTLPPVQISAEPPSP